MNIPEKEPGSPDAETPKFTVSDRRHWAQEETEATETVTERLPTYVAQLKMEAEEKDRRLREYIAAYKSKTAENDEFRQRLQKENEVQVDRLKARLFKQFLPILDNLQRALDAARANPDVNALQQGIELIAAQFLQELTQQGVERVNSQGRPFDPKTDEVLLTEETTDPGQDNLVLEDLEPGYRFKDQLIRPARVKVAKLKHQ